MDTKTATRGEPFVAQVAHKGFLPCVYPQMVFEPGARNEALLTMWTGIGSLTRVRAFVGLEGTGLDKTLLAEAATKWLASIVKVHMHFQSAELAEATTAVRTDVGFLAGMYTCMHSKTCLGTEPLLAMQTLKGPFARMHPLVQDHKPR